MKKSKDFFSSLNLALDVLESWTSLSIMMGSSEDQRSRGSKKWLQNILYREKKLELEPNFF
jgi:hypothetical protein